MFCKWSSMEQSCGWCRHTSSILSPVQKVSPWRPLPSSRVHVTGVLLFPQICKHRPTAVGIRQGFRWAEGEFSLGLMVWWMLSTVPGYCALCLAHLRMLRKSNDGLRNQWFFFFFFPPCFAFSKITGCCKQMEPPDVERKWRTSFGDNPVQLQPSDGSQMATSQGPDTS